MSMYYLSILKDGGNGYDYYESHFTEFQNEEPTVEELLYIIKKYGTITFMQKLHDSDNNNDEEVEENEYEQEKEISEETQQDGYQEDGYQEGY